MKRKWVLEQYIPRAEKFDKGDRVICNLKKNHGMRDDKSIVTDDSLDAVGSTKNIPDKVSCLFFMLTIKVISYLTLPYFRKKEN